MNDIDFGQYLGQYVLLNIITSIKIIPDFCIMIRKKSTLLLDKKYILILFKM